jgi:autotransporter-associated beta strand protein
MKPRHYLPLLAGLAAIHSASAVEITKADNTDALDQTTSWSGGNVPGSGDVAVWDNTVTGANTTVPGSDLSWQGIRIADPGGKVIIQRPTAPGNTLTLGSAGIDASAATVDLLIENNTVIGASQTWETASGRWIEQGSGGKGGITFNADTTLTLSGSGIVGLNTPSGSGNLVIDGAVFQAWSGTGPFTGTTTLNSGRIRIGSGASPFITAGSGALILNGGVIGSISTTARTIPKAVTIGGDIGIATPNDGGTGFTGTGFSTGAITFSGTVDLNGGTRTITNGVTTTFNNVISNGGFTKAGSGTLNLSGANTYTGGTTVNAGTLALGNNNVLADAGAVTVSGGTLSIAARSDTVGTVTLTSGSITGTTGVLSGSSYAVESGSISSILGGTGALTKSTGGTVTLSAVNTYTGATLVSAGTLLVNGALGNTAVTVDTDATIGGTGSLGGSLSFDGSALLQVVNLNDPLAVTGTITFGNGFGIANLTGIDWNSLDLDTPYTVLSTSQTFDAGDIGNFGIANAAPVGTGRSAYFQNGSLAVVVIPEPTTALLGSLGLLALLRRKR